ncbi:DcrB-related protein [Paraburkholderia sp. UCT2]|uniref:DcrB-related protein n=1 Tax=unclassified Paraburkholderia TaxID=2615204 RepID=UPI00165583B8|nr:DUF1795 domain-containing protein [Paraburkholderia sp. UCT2]MBC8733281.1 DUF1795 domain-containing protein [Paraburkholderia sp. UCT2]
MTSRYRIDEGSIDLPEGFEDRSTNIFVFGDPDRSPLNLNIARDTLDVGETLPAYVDRQIRKLEKILRGYRLQHRQAARLGSGDHVSEGEQIDATRKEGQQTIHQRQAAFLCAPRRALIFSGTSIRAFTGEQNALWSTWLASYQSSSAD